MFSKSSVFKEKKDNHFLSKLVIIVIFISVLFFLYKIINIVVILFFALFLNVLFSPFLNKFNKWKIKDWLWMIIIYSIILTIILLVFFSIIPIFISQTTVLIQTIVSFINDKYYIYLNSWIEWLNLPQFLNWFLSNLDLDEIFSSLKENISWISTFVWNNLKNFLVNWAWVIFSITGLFANVIMVLIFTFFIALERKQIRKFFYDILPKKISKNLKKTEPEIVTTLYSWLKWQIILCFSIFIATFFGLMFIRLFWVKIDEVFSLALIAGLMEFVPIIWAFIALIPAIAIAIWLWYKAVIVVFLLYIVIQQLENNFLVPYIMWKTLSISPFSVLITMIIWWTLFWIIWIIIAIPIVSVIKIFLSQYLDEKDE